jgi:hypothetical protein
MSDAPCSFASPVSGWSHAREGRASACQVGKNWQLIRNGKSPAKKQLKARILLRADESPLGPKWNDPKISKALGTYPMRVRRQFAQGGIDGVRPARQARMTARQFRQESR